MQPELGEDFSVEKQALGVEPLVGAGDRDLGPDDPRAGDAEDPLQVLLGPEGAELARARADNVLSHADPLAQYSAARQADADLLSVTVPLDRGLELSVSLR